ncbi:MAG: DUF3299 domain-containing protein [Burkholderiales bacterium]|nr:DUF3299 domain-containing protein [Burkholderiales bacterium]
MLRCTATAAFLWLATGAAAQQHQYLEASKPLAPGAVSADGTQEIRWQDLIPKNWRPKTKLLGRKLQAMNDNDPEALAFMRELQSEWDQAPTNPELEGRLVKLPGYLVPLEEVKGELKELLLVPYYGACIHVPPPPANQIIHIVLAKPTKGFRTMDPVWISGKLIVSRQETDMATTGYRMDAASIAKYQPPAP